MADETLPQDNAENFGDISKDLINAGCFVSITQAHNHVKEYLSLPGCLPQHDPKHIYGHVFGLNNLRKLIYQIDLYNSAQTDDTKLLKGVRVYQAVSERSDTNFPTAGKLRDLIFMPVLANGTDMPEKALEHLVEGPVLTGSRPCPNQCN